MPICECPHCHSRVLVFKDGICPSCQYDINDLTGVDLRKSSIELDATTRVPRVCVLCGIPTIREVRVTGHDARHNVSEGPGGLSLLLSILGLLFLPITFFVSKRRESHVVVGYSRLLPQCELCSTSEIILVSVDSFRESMTIVADQEFISELRRLNS